MSDITAPSQPWYRSLNRSQWNTLIASQLGWLFDGYETYALIISVGVALRQLLDPSQYSQIPVYVGTVIALTLLGWGIGGLMGGVIADYIGRKRTMMLAILGYSLMTGLSAFAWDWMSFAVLRFLVGVTIGSEWVTGASIVSELWPDKNRGKGVGLMQCGFGIGFFLASLAWLFIGPMGADAWRAMFLLGVVPALLTLWIRRAIPESDKWERVNERRVAAHERKRSGATLSGQEEALTRFTMADLFAEPEIRRRVILTFLMSLASTFAFWGISTWMPPYMAATAAKAGLPPQQWASYVAMATNGAAIFGYAGLGFLADVYGRKPVTIAYFALAFI
jgi:MFS family permease